MTNLAERTDQHVSAEDIVERMKPKPRYNSLSFDVVSLNEQITELVRDNETLDAGIDAWESEIHRITGEIRKAKRQKAKNEGQAEKLRAKRQIVAEAAFKASALDQP